MRELRGKRGRKETIDRRRQKKRAERKGEEERRKEVKNGKR